MPWIRVQSIPKACSWNHPFEIVCFQGLEDGYQKPGVDGLWFLCSFFVWVEGERGNLKRLVLSLRILLEMFTKSIQKALGAYIICLP